MKCCVVQLVCNYTVIAMDLNREVEMRSCAIEFSIKSVCDAVDYANFVKYPILELKKSRIFNIIRSIENTRESVFSIVNCNIKKNLFSISLICKIGNYATYKEKRVLNSLYLDKWNYCYVNSIKFLKKEWLIKKVKNVIKLVNENINDKVPFDSVFFDRFGKENKLILKTLSKFNYENIHSDFISSFLKDCNNPIWEEFSFSFFEKLINYKQVEYIKLNKLTYRYVVREYVIPKTNRRIDILISSNEAVLVIENKVCAIELDDQTEDYYIFTEENFTTKKRRYLLLSPDGISAKCPHFISITYDDLYNILKSIPNDKIRRILEKNMLDFYLDFIQMTIRNGLSHIKHRNINT